MSSEMISDSGALAYSGSLLESESSGRSIVPPMCTLHRDLVAGGQPHDVGGADVERRGDCRVAEEPHASPSRSVKLRFTTPRSRRYCPRLVGDLPLGHQRVALRRQSDAPRQLDRGLRRAHPHVVAEVDPQRSARSRTGPRRDSDCPAPLRDGQLARREVLARRLRRQVECSAGAQRIDHQRGTAARTASRSPPGATAPPSRRARRSARGRSRRGGGRAPRCWP